MCRIKYISDYVLNIVLVIVLNVIAESIMPSGAFKKYIKTFMGLVVIIMLARPLLEFSDFDIELEKYIVQDGINYEYDEELSYVFENAVDIEFEKNISYAIKNDIKENFGIDSEAFIKCENGEIKSVKIKCEEQNFSDIKSFIDKKYGIDCVKY